MPKKRAIIYWLMPAEPARELLREDTRILAQQLGAPRFEPHLTLFATSSGASPREVLRKVRGKPIRLDVGKMGFSSKFTKSLFLRMKPNSALKRMAAEVARAARVRAKAPSDPHISLLYKSLPLSAQKKLAGWIRTPFKKIVFDSIKAVRCISPTLTRGDVEDWKVIATKSLRR